MWGNLEIILFLPANKQSAQALTLGNPSKHFFFFFLRQRIAIKARAASDTICCWRKTLCQTWILSSSWHCSDVSVKSHCFVLCPAGMSSLWVFERINFHFFLPTMFVCSDCVRGSHRSEVVRHFRTRTSEMRATQSKLSGFQLCAERQHFELHHCYKGEGMKTVQSAFCCLEVHAFNNEKK